MRAKKIELDVDYIGGQGSLTEVEEKALSDFFKQQKMVKKMKNKIKKTNKPKELEVKS